MKSFNPLDARQPVVIYPSGGICDHLAALPALSALCGDRVVHCFHIELQTSLALVAETDLFAGVDSCLPHCADLHQS